MTETPAEALKAARTDQQIVDETNEVAREIYARRGYDAHEGYRFDRATHPHEVEAWETACWIEERYTGTDPVEALANIDE